MLDEASPEWQAIVQAAQEEGEVVWYSYPGGENNARAVEAFEEKYPEIKVSVTRMLPQDGPAVLEAERTTGSAGADVYMDPLPTWGQQQLAEDPGRLIKPVGPNVAARPDLQVEACNCVITGYTTLGAAWNTSLVDDPPTSLQDFLDPKWEGKIGLPEATVATQYYYDFLKKYGGEDYWERLAALNPTFYPGGAPLSQGIIAGEVWVTPYGSLNILTPAIDAGAPAEVQVPFDDAPAWGPPFLGHIVGWAQHPNAAQVLVNFLLSPAGQQAYMHTAVSVLHEPIEGTAGTVEDVDQFTGALPEHEIQAHIDEWRRVFGR